MCGIDGDAIAGFLQSGELAGEQSLVGKMAGAVMQALQNICITTTPLGVGGDAMQIFEIEVK